MSNLERSTDCATILLYFYEKISFYHDRRILWGSFTVKLEAGGARPVYSHTVKFIVVLACS